jgi:hypothetical protein
MNPKNGEGHITQEEHKLYHRRRRTSQRKKVQSDRRNYGNVSSFIIKRKIKDNFVFCIFLFFEEKNLFSNT